MTPNEIFLYTLTFTVIAFIIGLLLSVWRISINGESAIHHFVAGIILGAVSINLFPKILSTHNPNSIIISFFLGAIFIIFLDSFVSRVTKNKDGNTKSMGTIASASIDLFIDGILIGVAFIGGKSAGVSIAISLTLCATFLTASLGKILHRSKIIIIPSVLLCLPLGSYFASSLLSKHPSLYMMETLAFGVSVLLYLAIEELLKKAHGTKDRPWIKICFFLGFITIAALKFY